MAIMRFTIILIAGISLTIDTKEVKRMNEFNVVELSERILSEMERSGAKPGTLRHYRSTGFGAINRHFCEVGSADKVTASLLDAFVISQRKRCENKEIPIYTWRGIRCGAEVLKLYASIVGANLELPTAQKWYSVKTLLRCQPNPKQLADNSNIFGLVWRVREELSRQGVHPETLTHYTIAGFDKILSHHLLQGTTTYSPELTEALVVQSRGKVNEGELCRVMFQHLRKTAAMLAEFHDSGKATLQKMPRFGLRMPNSHLSILLNEFLDDHARPGNFSPFTIKCAKSSVRSLLFELEDSGYESFDMVTHKVISDAVTTIAKRHGGGLGKMLYSLKLFLKYLHKAGKTTSDLSLAIPELIPPRKRSIEGFSPEEIRKILDAINTETPCGKRDFAIFTLAAQTGLRAIDIANLKRGDINWRNNEIRIVQHKTGKALSLPLEPESGNAIAEYLLTARPKSDSPNIFIKQKGVPGPLSSNSLSAYAGAFRHRSEVDDPNKPGRGFHSFRRGFSTRLLENETPAELLQQMTGHMDIDSLRPYFSVNDLGLKDCALGLLTFEKGGGQ
jgi:site-specific recombinase XerD